MSKSTQPLTARQIEQRLKQISRDTGLIAVVLIGLGGLLIVLGWAGTRAGGIRGGAPTSLLFGATLILFAPGVWFAYAAVMIRRASGPVVKWSLFVAAGQFLASVVAVLLAAVAGPEFAVAVMTLLFFVPALIVLLIQLFRARHFIRAYEVARGFNVVAAHAMVAPTPGELPVATPVGLPVAMPADAPDAPFAPEKP